MSDRILLMAPPPGRIECVLVVDLKRPRQRNRPDFLRLRGEIFELPHFTGKAADGRPAAAGGLTTAR